MYASALSSKIISLILLLEAANMPQIKHRKCSITQRAQAMALIEFTNMPMHVVVKISGLSRHTIGHLRKRLRARGFNPEVSTFFEDKFFKDAPRSGRPRKSDVATKLAVEAQKVAEQDDAQGESAPSEAASSPTADDFPAQDTSASNSNLAERPGPTVSESATASKAPSDAQAPPGVRLTGNGTSPEPPAALTYPPYTGPPPAGSSVGTSNPQTYSFPLGAFSNSISLPPPTIPPGGPSSGISALQQYTQPNQPVTLQPQVANSLPQFPRRHEAGAHTTWGNNR